MSENSRLNAANNIETTLAENIADTDTELELSDTSGFPETPFRATLSEFDDPSVIEIVEVNSVDGAVVTVERGVEDTTAKSFSGGDNFEQRFTAGTYNELVGEERFDDHVSRHESGGEDELDLGGLDASNSITATNNNFREHYKINRSSNTAEFTITSVTPPSSSAGGSLAFLIEEDGFFSVQDGYMVLTYDDARENVELFNRNAGADEFYAYIHEDNADLLSHNDFSDISSDDHHIRFGEDSADSIADIPNRSYLDLTSRTHGNEDHSETFATETYVDENTGSDEETVTVSEDYTTQGESTVFVEMETGEKTVTLASADVEDGKIVRVMDKLGNAGENDIMIQTENDETINGSNSAIINSSYESLTMQSDGTDWFIISRMSGGI